MKKRFSLFILVLFVLMPMITDASATIEGVLNDKNQLDCVQGSQANERVCTIKIKVSNGVISENEKVVFKLTPTNATINKNSIAVINSNEWVFEKSDEIDLDNLYFKFIGTNNSGDIEVFKFSYTFSEDEEECYVTMQPLRTEMPEPDPTPDPDPDPEPDPEPDPVPDPDPEPDPEPEEDKEPEKPVEQVKTGISLPYIISGITLILGGYGIIRVKNKNKLHRI